MPSASVNFEGQIAAAAKAVEIHSITQFSWLGTRSPRLPRMVESAATSRTAREYLLARVASRLYEDFYASGGVCRESSEGREMLRAGPWLAILRAANGGTGPWDPGWVVVRLNGSDAWVVKQDLTLLVPTSACRATGRNAALRVGARVSIRYPKDLPAISPGFYMALGNRTWPERGGRGVVRLYWHLTPPGAEPFVRGVTEALNNVDLPFNLKVLDHPSRYRRCDAGVLYVPRSQCKRVLRDLRSTYWRLAPHLADDVPALTRPVAPGVGFAEDTLDGLSFGLNRCRLLAEGIVRAHEEKAHSLEARLATILGVLRDAGVDPNQPYLNPGSASDIDSILACEW